MADLLFHPVQHAEKHSASTSTLTKHESRNTMWLVTKQIMLLMCPEQTNVWTCMIYIMTFPTPAAEAVA